MRYTMFIYAPTAGLADIYKGKTIHHCFLEMMTWPIHMFPSPNAFELIMHRFKDNKTNEFLPIQHSKGIAELN